jgi:hypothetical protein
VSSSAVGSVDGRCDGVMILHEVMANGCDGAFGMALALTLAS